jgi:DNA-binding LytR/AlgR family response regulator
MNGINLAEKILKEFPRTNIIYITGYEKYAFESYRTHASAFLLKPIGPEMLEDALRNLRYPVSNITEDMLVEQSLTGSVIGMRIQKCREERGISRNDFAEALGCVLSTVGRWENGSRVPDVPMLMRIAKTLGVKIDDLLG